MILLPVDVKRNQNTTIHLGRRLRSRSIDLIEPSSPSAYIFTRSERAGDERRTGQQHRKQKDDKTNTRQDKPNNNRMETSEQQTRESERRAKAMSEPNFNEQTDS